MTDEFCFSPGTSFGLQLVLNVEQYEYISGPNSDVGLKVCFSLVQCKSCKLYSNEDPENTHQIQCEDTNIAIPR